MVRASKENIQFLFLHLYTVKHPMFVPHYKVIPYIRSSFIYTRSMFLALNFLHFKFLSVCVQIEWPQAGTLIWIELYLVVV